MPLVFVPEERSFFSWGDEVLPTPVMRLLRFATPHQQELVTASGRAKMEGFLIPVLEGAKALVLVPGGDQSQRSGSSTAWGLASQFGFELAAHRYFAPTLGPGKDQQVEARWHVLLTKSSLVQRMQAIADLMPMAAHAVPRTSQSGLQVWPAKAVLRHFCDALVDALCREPLPKLADVDHPAFPRRTGLSKQSKAWAYRLQHALTSKDAEFVPQGLGERNLKNVLHSWIEPLRGADVQQQLGFRLEIPESAKQPFVLHFSLRPESDGDLVIQASEIWSFSDSESPVAGTSRAELQDLYLRSMGHASQIYETLDEVLESDDPARCELNAQDAWEFLQHDAPRLSEAGFEVKIPTELTTLGQRKLRLRLRVKARSKVPGAASGGGALSLDGLVQFNWEAAIGDKTVTLREMNQLLRHKAPLVLHRGQWVSLEPGTTGKVSKALLQKGGTMPTAKAVVGVLAGEVQHNEERVEVQAQGSLKTALARLKRGPQKALTPPKGLQGTLRPYQERGYAWLSTMASLQLGAVLADDMGLGKTIQMLAFFLRLSKQPKASRPPGSILLVAPTSVLGNWEREAARFAPSLRSLRHYGKDRTKKAKDLQGEPSTLVITSYGLLRRDASLLRLVTWSCVVLDEAQHIKNAASATAKAAYALAAKHRFALTGTPVENRLAELWSIFEFTNAGLLGPLKRFQRDFVNPIERDGDTETSARLRRLTSPFLLRRLKSDPSIISDLPPKNEVKIMCSLSREQVALYKAQVDQQLRIIEESSGISRRGQVLALLTALKQICNHPAQYLGERARRGGRSNKLEHLLPAIEQVLAQGERALIFTQFRVMGELLVEAFSQAFGLEVPFLHGGTSRKSRDRMIEQFQDEAGDAPLLLLSIKAGGTGLNLTAANHVFHYDRWWNPAVEDQATDRAYRIGQKKTVHVYKMVCAETVEEKIDQLLEAKRSLADAVIGTGEKWITEMDNAQLRDLVRLGEPASKKGNRSD